MVSPISVVVAEIVMQHLEERALETCRQTIPLWLRYVDDTFTAVHKDEIDDVHDHLNEQNADIQFIKEIEENGKLPFLDCLVSRDNNELRTTVFTALLKLTLTGIQHLLLQWLYLTLRALPRPSHGSYSPTTFV